MSGSPVLRVASVGGMGNGSHMVTSICEGVEVRYLSLMSPLSYTYLNNMRVLNMNVLSRCVFTLFKFCVMIVVCVRRGMTTSRLTGS